MAVEKNMDELKQTVDEINQNVPHQPMTEEDLEQVDGGAALSLFDSVYRCDSKGNPTHWRDSRRRRGRVFYFKCPKCNKLLHQGTFGRLYCDPCDESWFAVTLPDSCKCYGRYEY